jgi:flagella basal body P-ring formation protein FlgA
MRACRLILILLALAGRPAAAGGPTVYLRPLAVLEPGRVALAGIAQVAAVDSREAGALAALDLGPVPGEPSWLPLEEVRRRVEGGYGRQVDLVGSGTALLPAGAVPAGREALAAALLEFLAREDGGGGRLEVELLSPLPEPAGVPVFTLGYSRRLQGRLAGRTQVLWASGSALVFIRNYLPVAHAAADLPRDRLLSEADVEYRELDITALPGRFLTGLEASFRTLSPIARGTVLDPARLERSFLVRTGERVTVVFLRPGLSVCVPGKALGSGGRGEEVEVALSAVPASKRFRGRVSAAGEVVVEQL